MNMIEIKTVDSTHTRKIAIVTRLFPILEGAGYHSSNVLTGNS